jgi:hypothetical protein
MFTVIVLSSQREQGYQSSYGVSTDVDGARYCRVGALWENGSRSRTPVGS